MSNLKIDIIYYKTSSDFEMEFNLSGCCRMRIFKDKMESRKEFVSALARDVNRSKVILVVTDLFGENCIIPTLSRSIGLKLISPDNREFGIKTEEDIMIPETAVPLVTKTGIYGGCIIESGPQSIIIVSSVRSLRHEIMKAYVHNYVFDVGQLFAYQERMGQNSQQMPFPSPVAPTNLSQTAKDVDEASAPEQDNANDADESLAEEEQKVVTENPPSTEKQIPEPPSFMLEESKTVLGISEVGDFDITADLEVGNNAPAKKKKSKPRRASSIILLIIVILLLIGFGILAYFFVYQPAMGIENQFINGENNIFSEIFKLF